jgi:hypothetical protein
MNTIGVLIELRWSNPYTQPPNGVRILAEIYRPYDDPEARKPPDVFDELHTLGDGYSHIYSFISPRIKELPPDKLASVRKKRIARRVQKKYPMFAEQFLAEEIAKNPEYYDGVTRSDLKEVRDKVLNNEAERLAYLQGRSGQVMVYGKSHTKTTFPESEKQNGLP